MQPLKTDASYKWLLWRVDIPWTGGPEALIKLWKKCMYDCELSSAVGLQWSPPHKTVAISYTSKYWYITAHMQHAHTY